MISIMPTVDGQRLSDFHHAGSLYVPVQNEQVGAEITACLTNLADAGFTLSDNMITLEVKFA